MFPLCFFTEARTQSQRKINKDSEVHGIRNLFTIFIKGPPTGRGGRGNCIRQFVFK